MATVTVLPQGTYPPGTRTLGPAAVPKNLSSFTLAFDRTNWADGVTLDLTVDLSLDGGVTWNPHPDVDPFPVGLSAVGGVQLDKNGNPYTTTAVSAAIPQPGSTTRSVRATITIGGGSLTTTATLTTA